MRLAFIAVLVFLTTSVLSAQAADMGDDGLHKTEWMRETFLDLREDLAEANDEGKRFAIIIEQRGCIYCKKMHEDVFPDPEIDAMISDNFFVVQLNMFGDLEVTDFDGEVLAEKDIMFKWGVNFTPTLMFFPESVTEGVNARQAAVAQMPGAFGRSTTLAVFEWILMEGYANDVSLQKYVATKFQ
ncbi:MAG: thioredoxin family protein [Paracoccaceae bacterium]|nr:thioredoxin family protein [Paracoccaceae bacterium]MDG2257149.1 thioredoxin family protein [Paracoccaceae bacterium]